MLRTALTSGLLCVCLVACGDDEGAGGGAGGGGASGSKEDRTKAALQQLFDRVKADDAPGASKWIVYRGSDAKRKWKAVVGYRSDEDKARVTRVMRSLKKYLDAGSPQFESFETEKESEGEWLIWRVKFGDEQAAFACLDIDGTIALGDID